MFPVLLLFISFVHSQTFVGPQWQDQSNDAKLSLLDNIIYNDTTAGSFPNALELAELFVEDMNLSFDTVADDMPDQGFPLGRRVKLVHSVGVVADAQWTVVPNSLGYTGILGSGCKDLYVRLSLATAPTTDTNGYVPGLAVKCLRSNVPSGNMFAMYSLQGQNSYNFFKHDLTNHPPDISPNAGFLLNELRSTFAKASNYPVMIGISDFATTDQDGNNTTAPVFPFRLVFHPTTALNGAFPDAPSSDWTGDLIQGLGNPQDLWYVYAVQNPNDAPSNFVQIATVTSLSPASTSSFGDNFMFHEHTRMENDFAYRPDWQAQADAIMANQRAVNYYTFPDLPFN